MPGQQLQTSAFILAKQLSGSDKFEQLTVFSGEHGLLHCLCRIASSKTASTPLDLFDEAELWLESTNQGRTWFIKEHRCIQRHPGIGRSYDTLRAAAALAHLVLRNPASDDSRAPIVTLLRQSFAALEAGARPDLVRLKTLFCFLRDEGYPVKQSWWQQLPPPDRDAATQLLNQPIAGQTPAPELVARLTQRLETWVAAETELRLGPA
jgi:recombinational DNA repair protein (RecF pathway)